MSNMRQHGENRAEVGSLPLRQLRNRIFLDNGSAKTMPPPGLVDPRNTQKTGRKFSPMGCFITVTIVVVLVAIALITGMHGSSSQQVSASAGGVPEARTTWQYEYAYAYVSADGRPIVVGAGSLGDVKRQLSPGSLSFFYRRAHRFFAQKLADTRPKK